jgi:hybrid cluster-associated redox disulfide protein
VASTALLHTLVSDVLSDRPAAVEVFVRRGMSCPGCPFARFETVADVAKTYQQDPEELAASLLEAGTDTAVAGEPAI